jgi:hypothetical protein
VARLHNAKHSQDGNELKNNMELSSKSLSALFFKILMRKRVQAEGNFDLSVVNESGIAVLTRLSSVSARRIRVKSYTDLKYASAGKRVKLSNNQSVPVTISYNEKFFGTPSIKITWFQGLQRFETDLRVYNIGIF